MTVASASPRSCRCSRSEVGRSSWSSRRRWRRYGSPRPRCRPVSPAGAAAAVDDEAAADGSSSGCEAVASHLHLSVGIGTGPGADVDAGETHEIHPVIHPPARWFPPVRRRETVPTIPQGISVDLGGATAWATMPICWTGDLVWMPLTSHRHLVRATVTVSVDLVLAVGVGVDFGDSVGLAMCDECVVGVGWDCCRGCSWCCWCWAMAWVWPR